MEIPKEIYIEKIAMMADDKTTINMLSVNKKYIKYFEYVFSKKYPLFVDFKKEDPRSFYIQMIGDLSRLESFFGIKYFKTADFHPVLLFNYIFSISSIYIDGILHDINKYVKNEKYINTRLYLLQDGTTKLGEINKGNIISNVLNYDLP